MTTWRRLPSGALEHEREDCWAIVGEADHQLWRLSLPRVWIREAGRSRAARVEALADAAASWHNPETGQAPPPVRDDSNLARAVEAVVAALEEDSDYGPLRPICLRCPRCGADGELVPEGLTRPSG